MAYKMMIFFKNICTKVFLHKIAIFHKFFAITNSFNQTWAKSFKREYLNGFKTEFYKEH